MLSGTPYLKIPRIIKNVTVAKKKEFKCDLESRRTPWLCHFLLFRSSCPDGRLQLPGSGEGAGPSAALP